MRLKIMVGALAVVGCLLFGQSGSLAQEDKLKRKADPKKVEQGAASRQAPDVKKQPQGFDGSAAGKGGSTLGQSPVPPVTGVQGVKSQPPLKQGEQPKLDRGQADGRFQPDKPRTSQEQMEHSKTKDKAQRQEYDQRVQERIQQIQQRVNQQQQAPLKTQAPQKAPSSSSSSSSSSSKK